MTPTTPKRAVRPHTHRLRRRLLDVLTAEHLLGRRLVVACSGGPDSLALTAVAAAADLDITAVIVDHGLQPDSQEQAGRAAAHCRTLGVSAQVSQVTVVDAGRGPEAAARAARYTALRLAAREQGAAAVLLAHTREDQAETVLLGIARGSGVRSLAGMAQRRDEFVRPFLDVSRSDVALVLGEIREEQPDVVAWQDPHNADPRFRRSAVRHRLLPALTEVLGPGVIDNLARTAALARADADLLDAHAELAVRRVARDGWAVGSLLELPDAIRSRVLRHGCLAGGCPAGDLTAQHVAAVDRLITAWRGQGPVSLPGGVRAARRYGRLVLTAGSAATADSAASW